MSTQTEQATLTGGTVDEADNNQGGTCALCGDDYEYNLREHLPQCDEREAIFQQDHPTADGAEVA